MQISWGRAVIATAGIGLLSACGHSSTSSSSSTVTNAAISSTSSASSSGPSAKASQSRASASRENDSSSTAPSHSSASSKKTLAVATGGGSTSSTQPAKSPSGNTASTGTGNSGPSSAAPKASSANSNNAKVGQQTGSGVSSITIPSIGLNHSVSAGGLNGGVLSPNPGEVEQFVGYGRVAPGKNGISVLAGHVTYNGPDVFYRLGDVPVGGKITVNFANGTHEDFIVTNKESINKDALTNDTRVWGSSSSPVLVLVTCDSNSGWANAQHHVNNLVLWARPA